MRKIKVGVLISMFGLAGLILSLSSQTIGSFSKVIVTIFCMGIITLGILIESPILERLKDRPEGDYEFDEV